MSRQDKATTERNAKTLRELVKRPENRVCADCKRNDPRWASWNIGVFVCIGCSGVHRSMGTHISKVKSVDLDMWTSEQMHNVQIWGNERANAYWEAHLKPGHIPPEHKIASFIRSKYESRRWAMEGPLPADPSVLVNGQGAAEPEATQPVPSPSTPIAPPSGTSTPQPNAAATAARRLTTRTLLSSDTFTPPSRAGIAAAPVVTQARLAPAPAPASALDDFFTLDFAPPSSTPHSNPAASASSAAQTKNQILAKFGAPPVQAVPQPQQFLGSFWPEPMSASSTIPAPSHEWGAFTSSSVAQAPSSSMSLFGQPQQPAMAPSVWGTDAQQNAPKNENSGVDAFAGLFDKMTSPSQTQQEKNNPWSTW